MRSPPAVPLRQTIQVPGYGPDIPPLHRPGEGLYGTVPEDVLQICPHQGGESLQGIPFLQPAFFQQRNAQLRQRTDQVAGRSAGAVIGCLPGGGQEKSPGAQSGQGLLPLGKMGPDPFQAEKSTRQFPPRSVFAANGE